MGTQPGGTPVSLRDIWPTNEETQALVADTVTPELFTSSYKDIFSGDDTWNGKTITVTVQPKEGKDSSSFMASVRLDNPMEIEYYRHGGILHKVLRQILASSS